MHQSNPITVAIFKDYSPNQMMLLPPSLAEMIETNHPVRVVGEIIDKINADSLFDQYKGGGTSSYHPRMLLKVLVYSYLCNIYSSRKIESALKENIHFMWLSGMNRPDHNTINRFRSERLKDVLKEIFSQVVLLLAESGHISLKEVYIDGTKIESRANKYTFVWGNAIKTNRAKILVQLKELWDYTQSVASEELQDRGDIDFTKIDSQKVKQTITEIETVLKGKQVDKAVKQKLGYARNMWPKNLEKYDQQEKILGERNSFSKTDPDATFMRMKEDHMKNGQLKPGYNLQISTNNQFILNYSHHQNPTDTTTLEPHIEEFKSIYNQSPEVIIADAGYGSEENYTFMENNRIEAYVKYNYFDKEANRRKSTLCENLYYNSLQDTLYCPMGQKMSLVATKKRVTENGFEQIISVYQAINCSGCPLRGSCHKSNGNKKIEINHNLKRLKTKAHDLLNSEKGLCYRKKRGADVEPVFGNIKWNKGFKRFLLKGLVKTEIETGLLAIAHNLQKLRA